MNRTRILVLPLLLAAVSCGHSTSTSPALTADVGRLGTAATQGTAAQVSQAADALRAEVARQLVSGRVSSDRAAAILDQVNRVLADTAVRPSPAPDAAPLVTHSPAPQYPAPGQGQGKGKEKGKGNSDGEHD